MVTRPEYRRLLEEAYSGATNEVRTGRGKRSSITHFDTCGERGMRIKEVDVDAAVFLVDLFHSLEHSAEI